jgi:7-cyano-7-deazaguanine synthase
MEPEVIVLLSGGVDSTACIDFYMEFGRPPYGLFIDYGQPAAAQEIRSATSVARHYSIPLKYLKLRGRKPKSAGLIAGRNSFLICTALMECPLSVSIIAMGIHSGTGYADCSESFLAHMQAAVDLLEPPRVHLAAPFITWTKADIYAYCHQRRVPIELTYSCEQGGLRPCGQCLSCKDREMLHART